MFFVFFLLNDSDGIGRTGTYIALDFLLQQAQAEGQIDIHWCVHFLRTQRVSLVQTLVSLITNSILDMLLLLNSTPPDKTFEWTTTPFLW